MSTEESFLCHHSFADTFPLTKFSPRIFRRANPPLFVLEVIFTCCFPAPDPGKVWPSPLTIAAPSRPAAPPQEICSSGCRVFLLSTTYICPPPERRFFFSIRCVGAYSLFYDASMVAGFPVLWFFSFSHFSGFSTPSFFFPLFSFFFVWVKAWVGPSRFLSRRFWSW